MKGGRISDLGTNFSHLERGSGMSKKLIAQIQAQVDAMRRNDIVKVNFTLRGREAQGLLDFQQEMGGAEIISVNDLASRIVAHSLERHYSAKQKSSVSDAE